MPEAGTHIPADVRAMIAKATSEQLERLLWDIIVAAPAKPEDVHYDA